MKLPCFLSGVSESDTDGNRSKTSGAQMTARWREDYVFVIFAHDESSMKFNALPGETN
jgi:hypothetical protein